jgi:hypothetical protein
MKHSLVTILCAIILASLSISAAGLESGGSWIWHADTQQGVNMPAGQRFFRKHVVLPADRVMKKAVMELSADNEFVLYINGKKVASGKNWMELSSFDVRKHLSAGDNVIAVEAGNWDVGEANPAGLIGSLRIDFDKGKPFILVTDVSWKTCSRKSDRWETAGFDDGVWKAARRLGPYGCAPWNAFAGGGGAATARARPTPSIYDEPATRTLSSEEGEQLLRDEWIFQAESKPLDERALQEISWAREIAGRLKKSTRPPDLSPELTILKALEKSLEELGGNADNTQKEDLYLQVRRIKRRILFKDPLVDFSKLVFIDVPQRYPHESMHRVYPQAQLNCVRLLVLDGLEPSGRIRKLTEDLGQGWYWRPDLSYDASKVVFCFRPEEDKTFHLYECNLDGSGLRQLTDGNYDDQDPVYMPDGRIVFVSNRGHSYARCVVGHPSTVVARCDPDGKNIYLISAGNEPEYTPSVMPNGQVLYTRWEYTDKELMRIQSLWTVNPDGTETSAFWGNQSYWPDLLMEARPIPGSRRVMFAGHGHHQVYMGSIGIIDPRKGFDYPNGLTKVTQDVRWAEVGDGPADKSGATRETENYHTSGAYRGYKAPYPLSEELFIVSARHHPVKDKFKIFLMDVYGNRELIYEGAFHSLYAMPVKPRAKAPVIPDRVQWAGAQKDGKTIKQGVFYCQDVYQGTPKILQGKAKYLRVIQQDFNTMTLGKKIQDTEHTRGEIHMHVGPVVSIVNNDSIKYVLGYVPIEKDGSVSFEAPPCVPLHFQLLDENHRALHTMRSFTNLMPGEFRGCVGCHEGQNAPPSQKRTIAMARKPVEIEPYRIGPKYSIGYERDIQPILDKYCGECHQGDGKGKKKLDLTLRPSRDGGVFPEPYIELTLGKKRRLGGSFPANCEGGIAGTILAQARPWTPETYKTFPPMTALSYKSKLVEIASSGKHPSSPPGADTAGKTKVKVDALSLEKLILWVDTLCTYRGEQELRAMADPDPENPIFKRSEYPPSDPTVKDVYAESPYRPRMRTAPLVNRAYRQDEFPNVESRLPRGENGKVLPAVSFTSAGERIELSWDGLKTVAVDR